jgi:hypothetical protein
VKVIRWHHKQTKSIWLSSHKYWQHSKFQYWKMIFINSLSNICRHMSSLLLYHDINIPTNLYTTSARIILWNFKISIKFESE